MAVIVDRAGPSLLHPCHAFFLAGSATLFLGALLSDFAYSSSYEIQWLNFASWLIAAALVLGAVVLVFAVVDLVRAVHRGGRGLLYGLLILTTWVLGFINALVHARDAWATQPAGLILSVIVAVLACLAAWLGFSTLRATSPRPAGPPTVNLATGGTP